MTKKDDDFLTPATKKIRFRGDLNSYYFDNHIEDIFDDPERRKFKHSADHNADDTNKKGTNAETRTLTAVLFDIIDIWLIFL